MPAHDPQGILLVDKPGAITSHDVVSRSRKALNTRKIGHAGTLDPMATGLLVLGVGPATRLLTYIVGLDKTYEATIRLGVSTDSDDADGATTAQTDAGGIHPDAITAAIVPLTGDILQVPSTVSAIKVNGRRAYDLARSGEEVELKSRAVTVSRFEVLDVRHEPGVVDVDVVVDCTSGTYIRALARDLGAALGVGGHLTALRRTRIGPFQVADAVATENITVAALAPSAEVAVLVLGEFAATEQEAVDLRHGKRLAGAAERLTQNPSAAIDPSGTLIGIVEQRGADVKSAMNMPNEATS